MDDIDNLRIELIGNKDLKFKVLSNEGFIVELVDQVVGNCSTPYKIVNELTIIKFLLKFNHHLIGIGPEQLSRLRHGLVKGLGVLINDLIASKTYDGKLMLLIVELLDLLAMSDNILKSNHQDDDDQIFRCIMVLLQLNEYPLLIHGLDLIPNIITGTNELVIIQQLLKRLHLELMHHASQDHPSTSQPSIKLIYKLILNLNYILNPANISDHNIRLNPETIMELEALIKLDNKLLTLNIINLLNLFNSQLLYLHKLIDMIEFNNYSINSFKILSQLINQDFSLINELIKMKIDVKLINYLNKNTQKFTLEEFSQANINDVLELLSLLTSNNEEFRVNLINYEFDFKQLLHVLVRDYKTYLKKLVRYLKRHEFKTSNKSNQLVSILNNSIFTNTLCLIRSLSRSVTLLRTFFIDCKIVDNLIDILKIIEILGLGDTSDNKLIILSIMANLILDFSSFRYNLIYNDDFFNNILLIYNNNKQHENTIPGEQLNLIVLQIIKNLMYNENEDNKIKLVSKYFQLSTFLPYLNYRKTVKDLKLELEDHSSKEVEEIHNLKLGQKLTSFDVLRNLSSNSNFFNQNLSIFISENLNINWDKFLIINITNLSIFNPKFAKYSNKHIINLLIKNEYPNLILSINYIENHKFLSNLSINLNKLLLKIWLNFLKLSPKNYKLSKAQRICVTNNLNSIRLSIIWILINLTWQNNLFNIKLFDSISKAHYSIESQEEEQTHPEPEVEEEDEDAEITEDNSGSFHDDESTSGAGNTGATIRLKNLSNHHKRASYLKKFGFLPVLQELSHQLLLDLNKDYDNFIINDLIEKTKTVIYQFELILSPNEKSLPGDNLDKLPKRPMVLGSTVHAEMPIPHDLQQQLHSQETQQLLPALSNIRSGRSSNVREDVNRGGEGFGYDSDDYIDAETDPVNHPGEFIDDQIDVDSSEEEPDDYWVR